MQNFLKLHLRPVFINGSYYRTPLTALNVSIPDDMFTIQINCVTFPYFSLSNAELIVIKAGISVQQYRLQAINLIHLIITNYPSYSSVFYEDFQSLTDNFQLLQSSEKRQLLRTVNSTQDYFYTSEILLQIQLNQLLLFPEELYFLALYYSKTPFDPLKLINILCALLPLKGISQILEIAFLDEQFRIKFDDYPELFTEIDVFQGLETCPKYIAYQKNKKENISVKVAARLGEEVNDIFLDILRNADDEGAEMADKLQSGEYIDFDDI
ncbi:hypothetical protein SS50377_22458 [Spironucleus salmonicida]|uniref:Uncharacterized protein n=1 Tax=Spironucleus salmonicida TaxID=348837 RepID=V6LEC8_9EUKA|nr:hypothetical protein SS50377_22458 [Spironucleus salmonicida]|eukprot:EST42051.1 Hypothetical protein SS50377_18358 [Spironucleus salmonicida]